jgi:hypothetical protein
MRTPGQTQTAEQNGSGSAEGTPATQPVQYIRGDLHLLLCRYQITNARLQEMREAFGCQGSGARAGRRGDGALVSAVGGQIWGGTCHLTGVGVGSAPGCGLAGRNRGPGAAWRERRRRRSEARATDRGPTSEFVRGHGHRHERLRRRRLCSRTAERNPRGRGTGTVVHVPRRRAAGLPVPASTGYGVDAGLPGPASFEAAGGTGGREGKGTVPRSRGDGSDRERGWSPRCAWPRTARRRGRACPSPARLLLPPIRSADWPLCSSPRSAPRQCVRPSVRPFRLYRAEETTGLVQGLRGRPAQFF